jgi:hypothetical protein
MTDRASSLLLIQAVTVAAGLALLTGVAIAGDKSSDKDALPGVTGDYHIAKPTPKPEPDDAVPASGPGEFKIGDTDVRISGDITIDIGAGGIGLPRH